MPEQREELVDSEIYIALLKDGKIGYAVEGRELSLLEALGILRIVENLMIERNKTKTAQANDMTKIHVINTDLRLS